jgi:hypothetical protein
MPVPSSLTDISSTPSANSPQGSETVGTQANEYIQTAYAFIAQVNAAKMPLAGGTFTGPVNLAADPASGLQPVTKNYGDSQYKFTVTGGVVNAPVRFAGLGTLAGVQGLTLGWNDDGNGSASLVNNHGLGGGGFLFRIVNSNNTSELGRVTVGATGSLNTTGVLSEANSRVWTAATLNPASYQPAGNYATNDYVNGTFATVTYVNSAFPTLGSFNSLVTTVNGKQASGNYVRSGTANAVTLSYDGTNHRLNVIIDGTQVGFLSIT